MKIISLEDKLNLLDEVKASGKFEQDVNDLEAETCETFMVIFYNTMEASLTC